MTSTSAQAGCTPGPWTISEVRTVDDNVMIVGGEGKEFGLIAEVVLDDDAALIVRAVNRDAQFEALIDALKDWLAFAGEELSEFDLEECESEKLCPKCESSGCINLKIRNARKALADIGEAS